MQVISGRSVRFWLVGIVFLLLDVFSSGQTITLSPKSGPPTTKLNISGSGFSPNSAVDIYFDTTDEVLIITDGTGAFAKTTLKTPASAVPGQHWVSAVQRSTGSGSQAAFTVQTNWAQQGFGPSHQGWNLYENVLNTSNVGAWICYGPATSALAYDRLCQWSEMAFTLPATITKFLRPKHQTAVPLGLSELVT